MRSIRTAMLVLWLTLTLSVALGSSVLKNKVQMLERKRDAINMNIQKNMESIHVLKAEWSHFNTPERLRKLAYDQLSLENAKPEQIINYSALQFNYEDSQKTNKGGINHKNLTTLVKAVKR